MLHLEIKCNKMTKNQIDLQIDGKESSSQKSTLHAGRENEMKNPEQHSLALK